MRIFLVRHGRSAWQDDPAAGLDSGLSDLGRTQTERLGRWAAARPELGPGDRFAPGEIVVSPMLRARQTAGALERALGLTARVCADLAEPPCRVESLLPVPRGPLCPSEAAPPAVEYAEVRARARRALEVLVEAAGRCPDGVVAVGHGGLSRTIVRVLLGVDTVCFGHLNTALTGMEWRSGRWRLTHVNLCEHLPVSIRT